ncbi:hypothetical protein BU15DRAFT_75284 [Melanogaster broomeanus]|nr:hypothetical protein BU15DRAFT_75284 [Melanogaster broomeanus]
MRTKVVDSHCGLQSHFTRLPDESARTGLAIGDVSIVTKDGESDVFFNICFTCRPPYSPLSRGSLKLQTRIPEDGDIVQCAFDGAEKFLATQTISEGTRSGSLSGNPTATLSISTAVSYQGKCGSLLGEKDARGP